MSMEPGKIPDLGDSVEVVGTFGGTLLMRVSDFVPEGTQISYADTKPRAGMHIGDPMDRALGGATEIVGSMRLAESVGVSMSQPAAPAAEEKAKPQPVRQKPPSLS
jgi:hypothetical protein